MKSSKRARPPETLSAEAKAWWRQITEVFVTDDPAAHLLLGTALESFDDMRKAQAILEKEGLTIKDRWGQQRQHPRKLDLAGLAKFDAEVLESVESGCYARRAIGGQVGGHHQAGPATCAGTETPDQQ